MKLKIISIPLLLTSSINIHASPTYNEFEQCNKRATSKLEHCLDDAKRSGYEKCWTKSRETYDSCAKNIFQMHYPPELSPQQKELQEELEKLMDEAE